MEPRSRPGSRSGCAPRVVRPPPCSRPKRRPPSPAATSISTTATRRVHGRPAAHPGRECDVDDDRPGHRQLPSRRLAGREEDDRRSRCRIAGAGGHPRGLHRWQGQVRRRSSTRVRPRATTSTTYDDIAAGTMCTVTETSDGSTTATKVVVTGDGQQVTIPLRRKQDGRRHQHLSLRPRLVDRDEDDCRPGCGPARGDHDPHGVRWQSPDPGFCDRRPHSRGRPVAAIR